MKLSNLTPIYKKLRYGSLGSNGALGYDNHLISVNGNFYEENLSAHPDSILIFDIENKYNKLSIKCALNDTSDIFAKADFNIYIDNNLVHSSCNVGKHDIRNIDVNLHGSKLMLQIKTNKPEFCHALWLDGVLHNDNKDFINGCMGDIKIFNHIDKIDNQLSICVCITPSYLIYAKSLLESIRLNSNLQQYKIILFSFDTNDEIIDLSNLYDCVLIKCERTNADTFLLKTCLYSAAKIIESSYYILIDIDMIVKKPLLDLINLIEHSNKKSIFICREQSIHKGRPLGNILVSNEWPYFGNDFANNILKLDSNSHNFNFICNGGFIAGSKEALLALDDMIRTIMPGANLWEKENPDVKWREQAILNLALSRLNNIVELENIYNYQLLHSEISESENAIIVHFNGEHGKKQYKNFKLKKYIQSKIDDTEFGIYIEKFNKNINFNVLENLNTQILNEVNFENFENIFIINDKHDLYASYIAYKFDKTISTISNFEIYSIADFIKIRSKLKIINIKDENVKFDCIVINMCNKEHINLSYCLIGLNLLSENGSIYVSENVATQQKLKDRLIDKKINIKDFGNYFQLSRE